MHQQQNSHHYSTTRGLIGTFLLCTILTLAPSFANGDCLIFSSQIVCNGADVTDFSLIELKSTLHQRYVAVYFEMLIISNTAVTSIQSGTFVDCEFGNVIIEDNSYLSHLSVDAFGKQTTQQLMVLNNLLLSDDSVFQLADRLSVSESAEYVKNNLGNIPTNAFSQLILPSNKNKGNVATSTTTDDEKMLSCTKLVISYNKIDKIETNAFNFMHSIEEIYLNNNLLRHIAKHGFNFITSEVEQEEQQKSKKVAHLAILLNDNQLTENSFEPEFIHLNNYYTTVLINISSNQLTAVPEKIFRPLMESNSIRLDLSRNPINCSNADGYNWLKSSAQFLGQTIGLKC